MVQNFSGVWYSWEIIGGFSCVLRLFWFPQFSYVTFNLVYFGFGIYFRHIRHRIFQSPHSIYLCSYPNWVVCSWFPPIYHATLLEEYRPPCVQAGEDVCPKYIFTQKFLLNMALESPQIPPPTSNMHVGSLSIHFGSFWTLRWSFDGMVVLSSSLIYPERSTDLQARKGEWRAKIQLSTPFTEFTGLDPAR